MADVADELSRHLPVRVVAPGREATRESWSASLEVFRFAAPRAPLSTLKLFHPLHGIRIAGVLHGGAAATRRAVDAGPTAHVVALWALPSGAWARSVARARRIPFSVWTLGSDIWTLGRVPGIRRYMRGVLRDADNVFSDGLQLAEATSAISGKPTEFLPSARQLAPIREKCLREQPPYRLLFIGRWHPNKGVDLLLEALEGLHDEDWALLERVDVCGGGALSQQVTAAVTRLQRLGRPVCIRGYVDAPTAATLLNVADYVLIPSRIESIPVVFSDAIRNGCPVIAMPVGDLPTLIQEGGVGVVAARVDPEAFRVAIREALARRPVEFSTALGRLASRFSVEDAIVPRLLGLAVSTGPVGGVV
ncbi:hypothetical protein GCM10027188_01670 [Lysobacter humi (ex Lee et al. 2017)]